MAAKKPRKNAAVPPPGHETTRYVPVELRRQVEARDGYRCVYCRTAGAMTMDHVLSYVWGGETVAGNLVCACADCNELKGQMPVDLFALWLARLQGTGLLQRYPLKKPLTAADITARVDRQLARPLPEV